MWCSKCTENDEFNKINVKIFAGIKKKQYLCSEI